MANEAIMPNEHEFRQSREGNLLIPIIALAAYGAMVVFTGGASAVFAPWVVGGLTAFCGGAFVFGQAEKDLEMKKVSRFSTYAGGSIVNSLKGAFAAAAFCMVPYAAEGMVYSVVPAATGGLSVGCMFISTDAMIALTGTVGYTITFSNMAVKASDSLEGVVGTNVMENMVGEEGYQKIAEASQSGSEIIFMMGLMNPNLYVKDQRVTNIRQVAAYDNSGGDTEVKITFPQEDAQLKHIFRDAEGHIADTSANRQKILDVTSNLDNYLGKDARGNDWYAIISEDGTQIWVRVRNCVIDNAGVNDVPRTWDSVTGLYNNTKK